MTVRVKRKKPPAEHSRYAGWGGGNKWASVDVRALQGGADGSLRWGCIRTHTVRDDAISHNGLRPR